jgi:hypothetical protein
MSINHDHWFSCHSPPWLLSPPDPLVGLSIERSAMIGVSTDYYQLYSSHNPSFNISKNILPF